MGIMSQANMKSPASQPERGNLRLPTANGLVAAVEANWTEIEESSARSARALADEALIAEAVGQGRVTRCPPGRAINAETFRPAPNAMLARGVMSVHWRSGKAGE